MRLLGGFRHDPHRRHDLSQAHHRSDGGLPAGWLFRGGQQITQIDVGMSREQVIGILGRPDGYRSAGDTEAMTYSNRLMPGWSWGDTADYNVVLTYGRVSAYGPGVVRQTSHNVLDIVPLR